MAGEKGKGKRNEVKVHMDIADQNGKMWDLDMTYHDLPEDEDGNVLGLMQTLTDSINNTAGVAGAQERKYKVNFSYNSSGGKKGEAKKDNLKYSQVLAHQGAGVKALQNLVNFGNAQVSSGDRS